MKDTNLFFHFLNASSFNKTNLVIFLGIPTCPINPFSPHQPIPGKPGSFRDRTLDDKLVYTPSYDKQNYLFCRLVFLVLGYL